MKFSAVALSVVSLAAFAAAQSPASSAPVPTNTSSFTPAQQKCIDACPADGAGVNCKAECLGLPGPTEEMANATTECMAKCEQGNGTEAETAKFAACGQACIAQNFFSSTLGSAQGTGAAGAGNNGGSGSDAKPTGSGAAAAASSAASSAAAAASSAAAGDSGAAGLQVGGAVAGVAALIAAVVAL